MTHLYDAIPSGVDTEQLSIAQKDQASLGAREHQIDQPWRRQRAQLLAEPPLRRAAPTRTNVAHTHTHAHTRFRQHTR